MNHATAEQLIAFESKLAKAYEAGELPFLLHLAGGDEAQLIEIFKQVAVGDWVFASHRAHYHALLAGIHPAEVEAKIMAGKSMFIYDAERNFCVSAVLAGTCGIAVGVAVALKEEGSPSRVWCFLGDGGEEQGHFWEAAMYAEGHDLPITFIIADNDQQVETPKLERRGGLVGGLENIMGCVRRYLYKPTYPHAGTKEVPNPAYRPEIVERFRR